MTPLRGSSVLEMAFAAPRLRTAATGFGFWRPGLFRCGAPDDEQFSDVLHRCGDSSDADNYVI